MKRFPFTTDQLKMLHQMALGLSKPGEIQPVLVATLKQLSKHMGMRRGMITVYHPDLKEITPVASIETPARSKDSLKYKLGEGITGQVIETGRPVVVPRLDNAPRFLDKSRARQNLDHSAIGFICVPIRFGEEIVGAISVDLKANTSSKLSSELNLLESVAELVASRVVRRRALDENLRLKDQTGIEKLIIGKSEAIRNVRNLISQVADSRATVLLSGETGTGKGLVARALHHASPRRTQPFVQINCGAIPENLIESELFGHEKGSFTGAVQTRSGRFEIAGAGTVFLDEVNTLPQSAQVKLLRVLQDREFEKVGSNKTIRNNARIIAATNRNLEQDIENGLFRADLFYRLNVFPIYIPPLRERGADILMLADYFIKQLSNQAKKDVNRIDTPAIDMLMAYHWPGNVRELENAIERSVLLSTNGVIEAHLLPPSLQIKTVESRTQGRGKLEALVASYEMGLIIDALKDAEGNQSKAARLLETSKRIMQYKIQKYGIDYKKFSR